MPFPQPEMAPGNSHLEENMQVGESALAYFPDGANSYSLRAFPAWKVAQGGDLTVIVLWSIRINLPEADNISFFKGAPVF